MYPATKTFRAVEADKSAFPMTEPASPKTDVKKKAKPPMTPTSGDGSTAIIPEEDSNQQVAKSQVYDDRFKLRNMQAVRHSFIPGKMSLAFL